LGSKESLLAGQTEKKQSVLQRKKKIMGKFLKQPVREATKIDQTAIQNRPRLG